MKYAARLVTALAALVLLVGAIVGLSTRAQAASSPPAFDTSVVVQSIDLPVTLDLEGGGTELALVVQTHDVLAAPEAASLIPTGSDDTSPGIGITVGALALLVGPIGGYFAWRNRKRARNHAPIATSVENTAIDDMTGKGTTARDETTQSTRLPSDQRHQV